MNKKDEERIIQKQILKEPIMIKFRLYGFFKNLKFYEPYILLLLLAWGLNLFQIGLLLLIQEIITYVFEIPSGIIADKFGKKNELMLCFLFYIASFIVYFFALGNLIHSFAFLAIGPLLFGMGEAFRSGTHKAMILYWMDENNYSKFKSFVYGTTRSWSLIGSTLNGILSIFLVVFAPEPRYVFPFAIVPYLADLILIATYPSYMNKKNLQEGKSIFSEFVSGFRDLFISLKNRDLRRSIISSSSYDAVYKSIKDYIQPIVKVFIAVMIINLGLSSIDISEENLVRIILGVLYSSFYLLSSISSRNAFKIKNLFKSSRKTMDIIYYSFSIVLILSAAFIWLQLPIVVVFLYLIIYVFANARRPIVIDYLGSIMKKEQRATILSAESQLKSIIVLAIAPLFGYIADYSIPLLFIIIAITLAVINLLFLSENSLILSFKWRKQKGKA